MDRWKSRGGKNKRSEEERISNCAKKVDKSRNTVFLPMFWGPEGLTKSGECKATWGDERRTMAPSCGANPMSK